VRFAQNDRMEPALTPSAAFRRGRGSAIGPMAATFTLRK
jgi:hypothetical protein